VIAFSLGLLVTLNVILHFPEWVPVALRQLWRRSARIALLGSACLYAR
jgi:hypothetical protein